MFTLTLEQHHKAAACAESLTRYMRLVAIPDTEGNRRLWEPLYTAWHNQVPESKRRAV